MSASDRYWLQVNKKSFKYDIIAIIILSGVLGGISPLGICYYMVRIVTYSMRFLNMNGLFSNREEVTSQILIMPFSRESIYKTYIKMMLLMSAVFTFIVAASKLIYGQGTMTYGNGEAIKPTILGNAGYYLILFSVLLLLNITLTSKINNNTSQKVYRKIAMLGFSFDLILVNACIMLAFSSSVIAQVVYFGLSLLSTVLLIVVLVKQIGKNYQDFVIRFRRYIHVE